MNDLQNIISCVLFVIKQCTMNVNIILIGDTILIIVPYVSKQIPYTTNSGVEMKKGVKDVKRDKNFPTNIMKIT